MVYCNHKRCLSDALNAITVLQVAAPSGCQRRARQVHATGRLCVVDHRNVVSSQAPEFVTEHAKDTQQLVCYWLTD